VIFRFGIGSERLTASLQILYVRKGTAYKEMIWETIFTTQDSLARREKRL